MQKGFDDGFQESFANHCTLNRVKGITLALLMADAEMENEARHLSLENIFQQLEDMEIVLSDYNSIASSGGPLHILSAFDHLKSQLLQLVTNRDGAQSELALQITECPSLSFSSFARVTSNSLETGGAQSSPAPPSASLRDRSDELSF